MHEVSPPPPLMMQASHSLLSLYRALEFRSHIHRWYVPGVETTNQSPARPREPRRVWEGGQQRVLSVLSQGSVAGATA